MPQPVSHIIEALPDLYDGYHTGWEQDPEPTEDITMQTGPYHKFVSYNRNDDRCSVCEETMFGGFHLNPRCEPHAYTTDTRNRKRGQVILQPPCDICGQLPGADIHILTLPGFDLTPAAPLVPEMTVPQSVDLATRGIEQNSPLFCHTDANPQQSLF